MESAGNQERLEMKSEYGEKSMENGIQASEQTFVDDIKRIIQKGRQSAYSAVSAVMTETYWNIGRRLLSRSSGEKNALSMGSTLWICFPRS